MLHPSFDSFVDRRLYCTLVQYCLRVQSANSTFSVARAADLEKSISLPKDTEMKPSLLFVALGFLLANNNAEGVPNPCKRPNDPPDLDDKVRIIAQSIDSIQPQLDNRFVPLLVREFFSQPFANRSVFCVICCSCLDSDTSMQ